MTAATSLDLNHILNWELKAGSHKFPGPNGGTCINEAAIVAAGFKYKKVKSAGDCPPCFSPVLSQFAISVNDLLEDGDRQELMMPLVTRLAGSVDEHWVEVARAQFIMQSLDDMFVVKGLGALDGQGPPSMFKNAAEARDDRMRAWRDVVRDPGGAIARYSHALQLLRLQLRETGAASWRPPIEPVFIDWSKPTTANESTYERVILFEQDVWPRAAKILTRAFQIGNRAAPIETAQVVERMAKIREKAGA